MNAEVRQRVKQCSIAALGSQHNQVRLASAQVIAKVATIELPKPGQWDDLMQMLLDYVVRPEASQSGWGHDDHCFYRRTWLRAVSDAVPCAGFG